MTDADQAIIKDALEEAQLTILSMVRPLIIYKLVLEDQRRTVGPDEVSGALLNLVDVGLRRAGYSIGVDVIEADLLATKSIWYGEEPTIIGLTAAA
jgi:hypothetical protein